MTLEERVKQLRDAGPAIKKEIESAAKSATIRAIETAAEKTPPTGPDDLRGTNTRSGAMKQHWATDSKTTPVWKGSTVETVLANNMEYASYVNDGHRMDRHFVPGLVVNKSSGLLEMNPDKKGGIIVGTKTSYVPGLHMTDDAREMYRKTVRSELRKLEDILK